MTLVETITVMEFIKMKAKLKAILLSVVLGCSIYSVAGDHRIFVVLPNGETVYDGERIVYHCPAKKESYGGRLHIKGQLMMIGTDAGWVGFVSPSHLEREQERSFWK